MDDTALDNAVKGGWITKLQREKLSRAYLTWLARTNKAKNHKPKPSLSAEAWAQKLASAKVKSSPTKKKKTTRKKRKSSVKK